MWSLKRETTVVSTFTLRIYTPVSVSAEIVNQSESSMIIGIDS